MKTKQLPPAASGRADIIPTGVYSTDWTTQALGLGYDSLRREIRAGRLRAAVRCGKRFFLGEWLLAWIREAPAAANGRAS